MEQNAAKVRFVRSLLEAGELYRHLRVRQQQFARTGTGPLPVPAITEAILRHADLRPQALAEHRARIEAARRMDGSR